MKKTVLAATLISLFFTIGLGSAQTAGSLLFPTSSDPTLLNWGTDTVDSFLSLHQIPAAQWTVIQTWGRQDLYDNLRSFAWMRIQGMITNPSQPLTSDEQYVLNQFAADAGTLKTSALQFAVDEKNRYLANKCTWQPDPAIATPSGYAYNGADYCPTIAWDPHQFGGPPAISPPKEYFLAYGQKKGWVDPITSRPGGLTSIPHITLGGALLLATGLAAAIALARLVYFLVILSGVDKFLGLTFIEAGAVSFAIAMILIVVTVFVYTENSRVEAEYPQLDQQLAQAKAASQFDRASLAAMLGTQSGYQLLYLTFLTEFVPSTNVFSTATLPVPNPPGDPEFVANSTLLPSISFKGWSGEIYTMQMWQGWLISTVNKPTQGIDSPSINTRFRYLWNGVRYEGARSGGLFIASKFQPSSSDVDCPVIPVAGVSVVPNFSVCKSFTTTSLPMDLTSGTANVSIYSPPVLNPNSDWFNGPWTDGFAQGQPRQITFTASGSPLPAISVTGGLPAGFAYAAINAGSGTLYWDGTGATGNYSIQFQASNGLGNTTATLNATVYNAVKIVQPGSSDLNLTLAAGTRYSIPVVAVGSPAPSLSVTSLGDTCGLSFPSSTSSSSLTLSGIIAPPTLPLARFCQITVAAVNSLAFTNPGCACRDQVTITITVVQPASQPTLVTTAATVPVLQTTQTTINTSGGSGVVQISITQGPTGPMAPTWISLQDNGDGTATLTATPPSNAPDTLLVPLWYHVANTAGNQATSSTDGVLLTINKTPVFTNESTGGYYLVYSTAGGSNQTAQVQSTGTMSIADPLPSGFSTLEIDCTGCPNSLTVYGAPQEGGIFTSTVSSSSSGGTTTAPLEMIFVQPAQITSAPKVNFYQGQTTTFRLLASGFPQGPLSGLLPGQADPLRFWGTPPDPGIQVQSADPSTGAPYYGYALLTGTPTLPRGTHPFTIYAQTGNTASPPGQQNFQLVVTIPGDVNGDGVVNCADVTYITSRYNQYAGMVNYDYNADYNHDGVINAKDTALVLPYLPRGTRCQ
jgi:hypothetical protein